MRRAARVDRNHAEIRKLYKSVGAVVVDTYQLKNAFDMLVAYRGMLYVIEVKDGKEFPNKFENFNDWEKHQFLKSKLTKGEEDCQMKLFGVNVPYHIVYDRESALQAIGCDIFI